MSYLRTFAPWIVFAAVPGAYWQWAALAAAVMASADVVVRRRRGVGFDALVIELGTVAFFVALTVLAIVAPDTALHAYAPALSNAALAVIAGGSLVARVPFTLGIAKQTTPQEVWKQPLFVRTAYVLTGVWTAAFAIGAVVLAVFAHADSVVRVVAQVLVFAVPMVFTVRYVACVRAKASALRAG
ncbi:hypothetical protein [Nocardia sp. AG03]|uniref:hypothetical protein n=1 Tax=Nocardia sp. AG03 TaxID=3025312 RepID=UPI0024184B37|nr:hypothetical protein [Nocardia sp. AG03]